MAVDTVIIDRSDARANTTGHKKVRSVSAWPPFTATSRDTTELTNGIRDAIWPWRYRVDQRPPFTPAEMVVMALAVCQEPMKRKDIFFWIFDTFEYFRETQGPQKLWSELSGREHSRVPWYQVGESIRSISHGPDFENILDSYEVPVETNGPPQGDEYQIKLNVGLKEAKEFLRPRLWPHQRQGHFPFLQLPAEIRTTIYEMVVRYPSAGIRISRERRQRWQPASKPTVHTFSRDLVAPLFTGLQRITNPITLRYHSRPGYKDLTWTRPQSHWPFLRIGELSEVLTLSWVSQQMRQEAGGMFFALNTLCFESALHLLSVLEQMPEIYRDSIERVTFAYGCGVVSYVHMREAFAIMASMKALRWLHISLIQQEWKNAPWHGDPSIEDRLQFNRAAKIPDRVEVVLDGDYPESTMRDIRLDPIEVDEPEVEEQNIESADGPGAAKGECLPSKTVELKRGRSLSLKKLLKPISTKSKSMLQTRRSGPVQPPQFEHHVQT